jgi:hypothetical protein
MAANKIVEDYLDEDEAINGQRYALISFVSPENVLDKKELFFFQRFLQSYEVNYKVKNLEGFLADSVMRINRDLNEKASALEKAGKDDIAADYRKNQLAMDGILGDYQEFVKKQQKDINKTKIVEAYDDFMFKEQTKLEEEFHSKNEFRTSIRGFKVRAVARDEKEAEVRAKKLQAKDKYHNIYCAEMGKWTPWDPKPHMVENQEYAQEELNTLMKKYKENEDNRSIFFEEQRKAGIAPGAAAGDKKLFGIQKAEEDVAETAVAVATDGNSVHAPLFDAPGDLVIARKAAAAAEKAAAAAVAATPVEATATPVASDAATAATAAPAAPASPAPVASMD